MNNVIRLRAYAALNDEGWRYSIMVDLSTVTAISSDGPTLLLVGGHTIRLEGVEYQEVVDDWRRGGVSQ